MPNQIQVELDGKAINLTVSDDQMSIVSDDGREFKAVITKCLSCTQCAFSTMGLSDCFKIPCTDDERGDDGAYFIELT
ncbi:MAG: hypothetical protein ACRDC4_13110 [Plesiomonas sp.]